jgi:hypothetical protein
MSPGRLSEPLILASADSGCLRPIRSAAHRQSSGQPGKSATRNVSAEDITSGRAPEILNHVNCAAVLVWLNQ